MIKLKVILKNGREMNASGPCMDFLEALIEGFLMSDYRVTEQEAKEMILKIEVIK